MDFAALLELLKSGEDVPDTIHDDLSTAHNDRVGAGDAKVAELEALLEGLNADVSRLKAHNYDLLTAVDQGNPEGDKGDLDEVNESGDDDGGEIISLEDIISYS